jgi:pyruvyltransferase
MVSAYWYKREVNFGDLLTPRLLEFFGVGARHSDVNQSDILLLGSILQDVSVNFSGIIAGAGLIGDLTKSFPEAKILGLRGYLTKDRLGIKYDVTLGDPGILASFLVRERSEKTHVLGIVPHYVDKADPRLALLATRYPDDILLIDVQQSPENVISLIDSCMFIVSSSLHGLIIADSLAIPNRWLMLSNKVLGDGFKFFDYYSVYDFKPNPLELVGDISLSQIINGCNSQSAIQVSRVKGAVFRMMRELSDRFRLDPMR